MLMTGEICAYIIPLERILGEVRKRFVSLNTLIIEQTTHVIHSRDPIGETVFREKVWLQIPRYERTMVMAAPDIPNVGEGAFKTKAVSGNAPLNAEKQPDRVVRQPNPDAAFRWLLMSNPKGGIAVFLTQLGVQLWDVGYDRCDGVVAYRVGARDPESPKLLVDKERFLPLLLSYVVPVDSERRLVTIRFKDYRKIDSGWYPHEIDYFLEGGGEEVYHVLNLTANAPIQADFFERKMEGSAVPTKPSAQQGNPDDRRLEEIMRALKDKYK